MQPHRFPSRRTFLRQTFLTAAAFPLAMPAFAERSKPEEARKLVLSAPLTHSDWMLKPHIPWGPAGVKHMLDQCKACGWSHIYWRVTDGGRALYQSKLMRPMGRWDDDSFWNPQSEADKALFRRFYPNYTDEQRKALLARFEPLDYSKFDCLAEAVRYGHTIGLKIHAWVTINEDDHGWGLQSEFTKKHPEFRWVKRDGTRYRSQLSFSFPEVQKYKLGILKELLRHYEIDGLFLDWIRTGDVRDNPQNDADGIADYGYEKPLIDRYKKKFQRDPKTIPNNEETWVKLRAEPQTDFMRAARQLVSKNKRKVPIAAMVGHPWHYRGELNKIDGNLRGLLLDVSTWAREGLVDGVVAAGYYRDGGNAELSAGALQKETGNEIEVWNFAWVPSNTAEADQSFAIADKTGAKQILYWEADYIDDRGSAKETVQAALRRRARI